MKPTIRAPIAVSCAYPDIPRCRFYDVAALTSALPRRSWHVAPVTLAASYRHARLEVARPQATWLRTAWPQQQGVAPVERPHAPPEESSEPQPWAAERPQPA